MGEPYQETAWWPNGRGDWCYAALWRTEQDEYRLTPVGERVQSRDARPRWDGDARPVVDGHSAPRSEARISDQLPDGQWLLAVMSHNPYEGMIGDVVPERAFTAVGDVRSGDPTPVVERLHQERREHPLRGLRGIPVTQRADSERRFQEGLGPVDSGSAWRYAAVYTDGNDVLRCTPVGDRVRVEDAEPRWDGDVHSVAELPRGMKSRDTPKQPAFESDQLPTGRWVLGVMYEHHPINSERHTFVVCGPPRSDDPREAVAELHRQIERSRLEPSRGRGPDVRSRLEPSRGRGPDERLGGYDRPTDRRGGRSGYDFPR